MSSTPLFQRRALSVALATALSTLAHAQQAPSANTGPAPLAVPAAAPVAPAAAASAAASRTPTQLPPVVVTGNPLRSNEVVAPVTVLRGDDLVLRRGSTLAETLDGLPGVSSSYFGPNANRPVIRGMDGDRIKVLSNSGASLDASSLSNDHAVPIDPLVVERVEVLRGPAALLYGGSAVGGVVNAIDNRVPTQAVTAPTGTAEFRYGGPATERGASGVVEAGGSGFAVHADAFWRKTDDMRVPTFQFPLEGGGSETRSTIVNSASQSEGGALGGSMLWDHGYIGASVDTFRSRYGVVVEPDVAIEMALDKLKLAGELRDIAGPIHRASFQWLGSDYQHQEIEASGEIATTFKNKGSDLRVELEQAKATLGGGSLGGVFGVQAGNNRFSALGAEAFVPSTDTRQFAAFVLQEFTADSGKLSLGGRLGRTTVDSDGDTTGDQPQFGSPQSRSFSSGSVALGGLLNLAPQWKLIGNLAYTERAPTFYELYANGLHVATAAYELGDPNQRMEKGSNLDLALQWSEGANLLKAGVFHNRFSNYIALLQTGQEAQTDDGPVPVFAFTGVPARFTGVEVEGNWRVLDASQRVDLVGKLDLTRATEQNTGQPLPNIPPLRLTVGANWSLGGWGARAEAVYAAAQNRVPTYDPPTPAYTIINLAASYKLAMAGSDGFVFLKLNNLTNELAYNAATIDTVRSLSPLPGRGLMVGVRVGF